MRGVDIRAVQIDALCVKAVMSVIDAVRIEHRDRLDHDRLGAGGGGGGKRGDKP